MTGEVGRTAELGDLGAVLSGTATREGTGKLDN
jgi:hypothetical protein